MTNLHLTRPDIFSEKALNVMRILREDPDSTDNDKRAEKLFGEHFHKGKT